MCRRSRPARPSPSATGPAPVGAGVDSDTVTGCATVGDALAEATACTPPSSRWPRSARCSSRAGPHTATRRCQPAPCWRCCRPSPGVMGGCRSCPTCQRPPRRRAAADHPRPARRAEGRRAAACDGPAPARDHRDDGAGLIALTGFTYPVLVALAVALIGGVLAYGWPTLLALPSPRGPTVVAIGSSRASPRRRHAQRALPRVDPGSARRLPVAAFLHQLLRRDGRVPPHGVRGRDRGRAGDRGDRGQLHPAAPHPRRGADDGGRHGGDRAVSPCGRGSGPPSAAPLGAAARHGARRRRPCSWPSWTDARCRPRRTDRAPGGAASPATRRASPCCRLVPLAARPGAASVLVCGVVVYALGRILIA